MNGFDGTISKASIRKQWDLPIIQQHAEKLERPLSYFGLPGPQIEDLLCWQSFLGIRTGIERLRKSAELQVANLDIHRQLMRNAMVAGISDGFELRRGYIEDLILTGVDIDGKRPRLSFGETRTVSSILLRRSKSGFFRRYGISRFCRGIEASKSNEKAY